MTQQMQARWRCFSYVVLVLAGYAVGSTMGLPLTAEAEVRGTTPEPFKSGAARSEIVLKEMATVLARMDGRLANLEKSANELVVLQKKTSGK